MPEEREEATPRKRAANYTWPTVIATAISTLGATGVAALSSRDSVLETKIMEKVRAEFVTKENSEIRASILSADVAEIRRAVSRIEEATKGIPRMDAKLESLEEKVRAK